MGGDREAEEEAGKLNGSAAFNLSPCLGFCCFFNLTSRKRKYDLCVVSSSMFGIMRCVANCTVDACNLLQRLRARSACLNRGRNKKRKKNEQTNEK